MRITLALAQINPVAGDLQGNVAKMVEAAKRSHAAGADLLITPELALCGYDAQDLLSREDFVQACDAALLQLRQALSAYPGLCVIVGHPAYSTAQTAPPLAHAKDGAHDSAHSSATPQVHNCASVVQDGAVLARYSKPYVPSYRLGDAAGYIQAGSQSCVVPIGSDRLPVGIVLCADLWPDASPSAPLAHSCAAGARCIVSLAASPWHMGKGHAREALLQQLAARHQVPIAYAHSVGAQDALLFDGGSVIVDATGQICARAAAFRSDLLCTTLIWDDAAPLAARATAQPATARPGTPPPCAPCDFAVLDGQSSDAAMAELWQALVLGLHDYVENNRFPGIVLGLSGGIDSALVLALAVDALGAERAHAVLLPSPYTAAMSLSDAAQMAQRLKVQYDTLSITPAMHSLTHSLAPLFAGKASDVTEENLQARIRGIMLMALSNKHGKLLLATGNKSEMATGYATLYGDMCGGFAPICDVYKTTVLALARWRNRFDLYQRGSVPIPERMISRPPSAELRPNQTDRDSLPDYAVLDAILWAHIENQYSAAHIEQLGFARSTVTRVLQLLQRGAFKRHQAAPGTRVSSRSLGRDWHYPLTNGYRPWA